MRSASPRRSTVSTGDGSLAILAGEDLRMSDDERERARRTLDFEKRARDIPLITLDKYTEWSAAKLEEGVSPALIANLDAQAVWMLPEQAPEIGEDFFEEMLVDLKAEIGEE
jgi:hypothetical protein